MLAVFEDMNTAISRDNEQVFQFYNEIHNNFLAVFIEILKNYTFGFPATNPKNIDADFCGNKEHFKNQNEVENLENLKNSISKNPSDKNTLSNDKENELAVPVFNNPSEISKPSLVNQELLHENTNTHVPINMNNSELVMPNALTSDSHRIANDGEISQKEENNWKPKNQSLKTSEIKKSNSSLKAEILSFKNKIKDQNNNSKKSVDVQVKLRDSPTTKTSKLPNIDSNGNELTEDPPSYLLDPENDNAVEIDDDQKQTTEIPKPKTQSKKILKPALEFQTFKIISIKKLRELIDDFVSHKKAFDVQCVDINTTRSSAENYLCLYLQKKYGLSELTMLNALSVVESVKFHAAADYKVAWFDYVSQLDSQKPN